MNQTNGISGIFAVIIGVFLLIEGIWGEFSDVVFGVLTTNRIHATIHILLGIVGIYTGLRVCLNFQEASCLSIIRIIAN